jgi:lipoprotein-anchoring transpeptidase ErfK/SrfK
MLILASALLFSCSINNPLAQSPPATITPTATSTPGPLTTPIPNELGLTIEENEIIGEANLVPFTFNPVHGSQERILERHAEQKEDLYRFSSTAVIDDEYYLDASTYFTGPEDGTVTLRQNGQIIFEVDVGDGSPIENFQRLLVEDGQWVLEVAHVTRWMEGTTAYGDIVGQVYRDGVSLNEQYGYDEIFGYQLLDDKPFFFYKLDGKVHLSYDGRDLPIWYDEVPHYRCCGPSLLNPDAAPNWVGFWGKRDGIWYYTEVGRY